MKVIKIQISHRTKPMYAIEMPSGKYQGQYTDEFGLIRYNAWTRKKDAQRFLEKILNDAKELVGQFSEVKGN